VPASCRQDLNDIFFAFLAQFGFALTDVLIPSLLQARTRAMDLQSGHFQDEHAVTTIGLISLFILWFATKRIHDERRRALCCLQAVFSRCLDRQYWHWPRLLDLVKRVNLDCGDRCPLGGGEMCLHVAEAFQKGSAITDGSHWSQVVHVLRELAVGMCRDSQVALTILVTSLGKAIDEHAHTKSAPMNNAMLQKLWPFGRKGVRKDEDCKFFVSVDAIKKRKLHSASQAIRVLDDENASAARLGGRLENRACLEALFAARAVLNGNGVVWAMEDACRHGKGGAETTCYLLWDSEANYGFVGPNQVRSARGKWAN
jgi:hypothetical protein